jgi:diacylglycerol kinase family enzyme
MYHYIYDNYLLEKKYQNIIAKIESRLTDLGINGKIIKFSAFKNLSKTINEELSQDVKTIVVVGNSKTLNQSLNLIKNKKINFGFIPIGPNNEIAKLLDIPEGEAACEILSARIIQEINLGLINEKYYFISYLELPGDNIYINCDDNYFINTTNHNNIVTISNIYLGENQPSIKNNSGYLNLIIKSTEKQWFKSKKEYFSYFKADKLKINSDKSIPILLVDEKIILKTPIKIEIAKEKIKIITGKNRKIH